MARIVGKGKKSETIIGLVLGFRGKEVDLDRLQELIHSS